MNYFTNWTKSQKEDGPEEKPDPVIYEGEAPEKETTKAEPYWEKKASIHVDKLIQFYEEYEKHEEEMKLKDTSKMAQNELYQLSHKKQLLLAAILSEKALLDAVNAISNEIEA